MNSQIFSIVSPSAESTQERFTAGSCFERQVQLFLQTINPKLTKLRIGLLPTALSYSSRDAGMLAGYQELFAQNGVIAFEIFDYAFDHELFQLVDAIYVLGDLTRKALDVWGSLKIDARLRQAYTMGIPLAGDGTGAVCWFEQVCYSQSLAPVICQKVPSQVVPTPLRNEMVSAGISGGGDFRAEDSAVMFQKALGILPGVLVQGLSLDEPIGTGDFGGPVYLAVPGEVFQFVNGVLTKRVQLG